MSAHRHRPDTRATTAVRNAERFVQIEMTHVGAEVPGFREPDEGVQVGAVDIDLATMTMHDIADLTDGSLEHTVSRGIGDHQCRETIADFLALAGEISEINVAVGVAGNYDNLHACHYGAGGVGSVCARRNQAHGALQVAATAVIGANRQETGEFSLAAGIRLQADGVIAGDLAQITLEFVNQLQVAGDIFERGVRVDVCEVGPRHGDHLGGGIQLHRARTKRNHRAVECEIFVGESSQISQHVGLRAVVAKRRLVEKLVVAQQSASDADLHGTLG